MTQTLEQREADAAASEDRVAPGRGAWAGAAAVTAAMGVGHLVAAVTDRAASPLVAVASRVVDASPQPLKEWAVATLGTLDKPVLVAVVGAVALLLGAAIGRLGPGTRSWLAVGALGLIVTVAALLAPTASGLSFLPGLAATVTGALALRALGPHARPEQLPEWPSSADLAAAERGRRTLLLGVAATASLGLLSGVAGELIRPSKQVRTVTLPSPRRTLPPRPDTLPVPGIQPFTTPQRDLYRVDINLTVPRIDVADWRLEINGMVDRPYTLAWDDLVALEVIERDTTLMCVSNEIGGPYAGSGRWTGVRTRDLLAKAGVRPGADMVLSTSWDGFTVSTPLEALTDDRDALVAVGFNGELLHADHGYPARLVTPGLYGFVGATKWLRTLTVTRFADKTAYWTTRGWSERGPMKLSSRIETPVRGGRVIAGTVAIGGSAWASRVAVQGVEVRVDGGPWQTATLGPDAGLDTWRQWWLPWQATHGSHLLECRAYDATGAMQSEREVPVAPDGPEGWHMVRVEVE